MVQWAIKLSELGIQYKPRLALKGQLLVDFLVEIPQRDVNSDNAGWWILNVDDTSRQTGTGIGLQLKEQTIRLDFPASDNETRYEAILAEIDLIKFVSLEKIIIRSDSQLVVGQVNGEYETRD